MVKKKIYHKTETSLKYIIIIIIIIIIPSPLDWKLAASCIRYQLYKPTLAKHDFARALGQ